MNISKLSQFGVDLAGREFGKNVYDLIIKDTTFPITLDFEGVGSMGSSFADEVIVKIAKQQENRIIVKNINRVIKSCLNDVKDEAAIEYLTIVYTDPPNITIYVCCNCSYLETFLICGPLVT